MQPYPCHWMLLISTNPCNQTPKPTLDTINFTFPLAEAVISPCWKNCAACPRRSPLLSTSLELASRLVLAFSRSSKCHLFYSRGSMDLPLLHLQLPRMADTTTNINSSAILGKMRETWEGVEGDIDVREWGTWILLTFANREAKDLVWNNRPYRVQNKLVLLKQFSEDFDPLSSSVDTADIWVRIPLLPFFFHNAHALNMIIRDNNIGTFIRMDERTSIKNKRRFVRFCINVTVPDVPGFVKIEHSGKTILTFKLWSEDFSPGCGCCGEPDHLFENCFLNNLPPQIFEFNLTGSNEDEEAARATKQRIIGNLMSKAAAISTVKKDPNFIRQAPNPASKFNSAGLQLSTTHGQEMYNSQLLAQMHHMSYASPNPMSLPLALAPHMMRPVLQNVALTPYHPRFVPVPPHIDTVHSPAASEKSSSTILRKMDNMEIAQTASPSHGTEQPRKDEVEDNVPPPANKKQKKSKAGKNKGIIIN